MSASGLHNNKLTSITSGGQTANFYHDNNGNMTSYSGPLGAKTIVYNDLNQVRYLTYGSVTDAYT